MAYASITYTNASGTTFALTNSDGNAIEYLRQDDISVRVNGTLQTIITDYTFNAAGTAIVLNSAVANATVLLSRITSITDATVSFTAGSTLTAQDLNNSDKQNRFALQEFSDTYDALTTGTGDLSVLDGFIGANEAWLGDDAHAATTGAIDGRVDAKIDTALTTDIAAGNAITVTDNSPGAGQVTIAVTDGAIDTAELADSAVTEAKIASNAVTTAKIGDGQVTNAKLADSELQTLAGIGSDQASSLVALTNAEIQTLDGISASTAELNQLDGNTLTNTPTWSSTTEYPTANAINSRIATIVDSVGGFVAIQDDQSFPATNPDPQGDAGTVVSIANAGGLVVNAAGESTTGRTTDSNIVTITGFPASMQSETVADGLGLQVQTTSTEHTYTYHKLIAKEADILQLSDDINDFNARYRVGASDPTTDNDEGDLFYNTTNDALKAFDGTNWTVAATGVASNVGFTPAGNLAATNVQAAIQELDTEKISFAAPQLGGNLDVNGQSIVSTSDGNIVLEPDGTGRVDVNSALDADSINIPTGQGSLTVGANFTVDNNGNVTIGNNTQLNDHVTIGPGSELRFMEAVGGGGHEVRIDSPLILASTYTLTLPTSLPDVAGKAVISDLNGDLSWGFAGGAKGGSNDQVFFENDQTVTTSYSITANKNAMSAGPITINSGVVVTVCWSYYY
jgi:hypothetical protein